MSDAAPADAHNGAAPETNTNEVPSSSEAGSVGGAGVGVAPVQPSSSDAAAPPVAPFDRRAAEQSTAVPDEDGTLIIPSKLFVGALSPYATDDTLREYFAPYGEIAESRIQRDKFTGESRKFGFVVYREPAGAAAAIAANKECGGMQMEGKRINVRYAEAQSQPGGRSGPPPRFGGDRDFREGQYRGHDGRERDAERAQRDQPHRGRDATKLFVGRLDANLSDAQLTAYFTRFGAVAECVIMREKGTGASRGFAFLHFESPASMEACLAQREHVVDGCTISIERSKPPRAAADDHRRDDRYPPYGGRDERRDFGGRDERYGRDPRDARDAGYGGNAPFGMYGAPDPYAYYAAAAAQFAQYGYGGGAYGGGAAPPSAASGGSRRDDRAPRRDEFPPNAPYGAYNQQGGAYPPGAPPAAAYQQPASAYPPQQGGYGAQQRGYDDRYSGAPAPFGTPAGYPPVPAAGGAPGGYPPYGAYPQQQQNSPSKYPQQQQPYR